MKKSHILLAVLLMAALVSCQENEIRNDDLIVKDGDIVFRMNGNGRATKSMDSAAPMKGVTIDLGAESGTRFFLEETIVNLDDIVLGPQTKGTPAYTENLGQLYADNLGVSAVGGNFGDIAYENAENEIGDDGKWLFKHHYTSDPWPDEETPVDFYLRMPASPAGVTLGGKANGSITFTYASPNTATATQDILFGYRSLAKKDYPKTGIPAVLYHALTGVKFAIGNDDDDISDNNIAITEVIFEGLYDSGTCVVTPAEDGSTASADAVEWKSPSSREDFTISSGSLLADGAQQIADYSESDYTFPASFSSAGITNNMNDNNASKTFWLIPQAFEGRDDVMLTIKYNYGDKTGIETKLMLGEIFGKRGIEWKAGELHTYNIRIAEVNLQIDDQVTMSQAFITSNDWKDAEGSTKHDVVITNTGNTPAFIRAAIVGQWIDDKGKPVFAFTDYVGGELVVEEVPSWYQDQFGNPVDEHGNPSNYKFGYFNELVGYVGPTDEDDYTAYSGTKWVKGDDGYYYYTEAVDAGDSTEEPLFESYVISWVPEIAIGGKTFDVTFVLEVATQAISANQSNGAPWNSYTDAWTNAAKQ